MPSRYDQVYPPDLRQRERELVERRRAAAGLDSPSEPSTGSWPDGTVGVALSGGGIRSATFCLGVFQVLARRGLLRRVDLLSTVSGGGYVGSFLGALITRAGDAGSGTRGIDAASSALADPSSPPVRWLREHGRYMAPTGAGDELLAAAVYLRNLVSVHVVLATLVLTVFGLATVLRAAVAGWAAAAGVPGVGQDGLGTVGLIWWSPWMVVPGALLALWALPVGWAYWFILREKGRTWRDCFGWPTGFAIYATAFAAAASWAALPGDPGPGLRRWGLVLAVLGSFLGLLLTLHRRTRVDAARPPGPEAGRARLGRRSLAAWLVITVQVAAVLGLGAALLGEGRGAAPAWMPPVWLTAAAALGALLWWERAIRKASTEASLPSPGSADGKAGGAAAEPTGRRFIEDRERFQRSWLSSRLRLALVVTAAFFGVALVDSLGQTLYAWWASPGGSTMAALASGGGLLGVLAAARRMALLVGQGPGGRRLSMRKGLVLGLAAGLAIGGMLVVASAVVHGTAWRGGVPAGDPWRSVGIAQATSSGASPAGGPVAAGQTAGGPAPAPPAARERPRMDVTVLLGASLLGLILSLLLAQTLSFVNGSSHHALYSARLTRAYLGASNPLRQDPRFPDAQRITDPIDGDDVPLAMYRPFDQGGPLHLVNVTINETVSGKSQIEQRDRKGVGLAVGPAGLSASRTHHALWGDGGTDYVVPTRDAYETAGERDQEPRYHVFFEDPVGWWRRATEARARGGQPEDGDGGHRVQALSLGNWVAISGAAFTTGLGAQTSLSLSLLLGLANVRLGYWWNSGVRPWKRAGRPRLRVVARLGEWASEALPVQSFLLQEMAARFHGPQRRYWYLSDGGHFENTGCYELVRRRVPFILACDCGRDADYAFEDVANLARKIRTDYGAELRFLSRADIAARLGGDAAAEALASRFAAPGELVAPPAAGAGGRGGEPPEAATPCCAAHAMLGEVFYDGAAQPGTLILFLKPGLTGDEPVDVTNYRRQRGDFPQESTVDQYFDEAQWESYRKLGEHVAEAVLSGAAAAAGWHPAALRPLPAVPA
jgi:hypothetical protein